MEIVLILFKASHKTLHVITFIIILYIVKYIGYSNGNLFIANSKEIMVYTMPEELNKG